MLTALYNLAPGQKEVIITGMHAQSALCDNTDSGSLRFPANAERCRIMGDLPCSITYLHQHT